VPLLHAWFWHGTPLAHAPLGLHFSTLLPCSEQRLDPGAQDPVHTPETHASVPQSEAAPHVPVALQV
jgi:hypothetical protein